MDKSQAYTEIYSLLYGKDKQDLNHNERMAEIKNVLHTLSHTSFTNGKKAGKIEVIDTLHKLIEK